MSTFEPKFREEVEKCWIDNELFTLGHILGHGEWNCDISIVNENHKENVMNSIQRF